jgi:hypothetical protein
VLQKVIERMKNAPILDFHCVARKLKWIFDTHQAVITTRRKQKKAFQLFQNFGFWPHATAAHVTHVHTQHVATRRVWQRAHMKKRDVIKIQRAE